MNNQATNQAIKTANVVHQHAYQAAFRACNEAEAVAWAAHERTRDTVRPAVWLESKAKFDADMAYFAALGSAQAVREAAFKAADAARAAAIESAS